MIDFRYKLICLIKVKWNATQKTGIFHHLENDKK